jgi:hypothetical protein
MKLRRLIPAALAIAAIAPLTAGLPHQDGGKIFGGMSSRTGLLLSDDIVVALVQTSSGDLARDTVARLSLWDRSQVTPGYRQAAEWMAERAREIGLRDVAIEEFPSDGQAQYFGNGTERLWKVGKADLWITSPFRLKLTSYDEMPISLARNSTSADVEAELVDVGEGTSDRDYASVDVKGKIVLASGSPYVVTMRAVSQKGALGVVSYAVVPSFDLQNRLPGDYPSQVGWNSIQAPREGQPGRWAFLISSRRAQEIKGLLKKGPVKIRASVQADLLPGSLDVVSGIIPGTSPAAGEVVITAHLDHYKPGANDNASGSAAILEMARTMRSLIDAGTLPPPVRAIRFLWVPEYSGTWAWFSKHLADPVRRVLELNFDMVGESIKSANAVFAVSYSPDANPSFLNGLAESIVDFINVHNDDRYPARPDLQAVSLSGSRDRIGIRMAPYMTGTDHELFNNAGIPGTTLGVFPDDHYHSSLDAIEQVDATQLHRAIVFGLIGMTTAAYAGDAQAADLAWQSLLYGRRRAAAAESEAARSLLAATPAGFSQADREAKALLRHVYRRERAAIASCSAFAAGDEAKRLVERAAAMMERDLPAADKRLESLAAARAKDFGVVRAAVPAPGEAEKRASRLVPAWEPGLRLMSINGAIAKAGNGKDVPILKAQTALIGAMRALRARGTSELRLMGLANAPATWVDGRRSILEIAEAMAVEYAAIPADALEAYFRIFEKAGAMKILESR